MTINEALTEALRRFLMCGSWKGDALRATRTGLGTPTQYRSVVHAGLMESVGTPRVLLGIQWWRLTKEGTALVQLALDSGYDLGDIEGGKRIPWQRWRKQLVATRRQLTTWRAPGHTPVPWKVYGYVIDSDSNRQGNDVLERVCVMDDGPTCKESAANTRLVLAAPALLAACVSAYSVINELGSLAWTNDDVCPDGVQSIGDVLSAAIAATEARKRK